MIEIFTEQPKFSKRGSPVAANCGQKIRKAVIVYISFIT